MERITAETLETFFNKLGEQISHPITFYLVGGSALILLGSTRETIDIDYAIEKSSKEFEDILEKLSE